MISKEETEFAVRLHRLMSDWARRYIPGGAMLFPALSDELDVIQRRVEDDIRRNDGLRERLADVFTLWHPAWVREKKETPVVGEEVEHGDATGEGRAPPGE